MEEKGSCSTSATASDRDDAIPPPDNFFDHFLQRSSSSSSSLARTQAGDGISVVESSDGGGGVYLPQVSGLHEPSSLMGASENKADVYDCESGECLDALLEEVPPKPNPPSSSSKRSRTAEFHNLSEKRRRSRINEKMNALQSLIPNSNKTDKASMLDEVIEYLKQLQLQVQMLSMRNGLTLHPMFLPRVLQSVQISQIRALFGDETDNLQSNMAGNNIPINQEPSAQRAIFGPPNQRLSSNEPHLTDKFGAGLTFGLESSMQIHPGAYQLNPASEVVCREDMLTLRQSNVNPSDTCLFGGPSTNIYQPKIER